MGFWTNNTKGHDGNGTIPPPIQTTKVMGTTTYVGGVANCAACGTGNAVAGRPGQVIKNHRVECRTCPVTTEYATATFACNN